MFIFKSGGSGELGVGEWTKIHGEPLIYPIFSWEPIKKFYFLSVGKAKLFERVASKKDNIYFWRIRMSPEN